MSYRFPSFLTLVIFLMITIVGIFFFNSFPANAGQDVFQDISGHIRTARQAAGYADPNQGSVQSIVAKIINVFLGLLGTIFVVLLIYGGYLWMTAGGDEEQVKKAQTLIRNAVIGIVVVLAAYAITQFVVKGLTGATVR